VPVTLLCPNLKCRAVLQVPDEMRGKIVRCGHCGKPFRVPLGKGQVPTREEPSQQTESPATQE